MIEVTKSELARERLTKAEERRAVEEFDGDPAWTREAIVEFAKHEKIRARKVAANEWKNSATRDLQARVARLERIVGHDGKKIVKVLAEALGGVLPAWAAKHGVLHYRGTWDEGTEYGKGATVTSDGSMWIAVAATPKGARPGKAPEWRLAVKAGSGR